MRIVVYDSLLNDVSKFAWGVGGGFNRKDPSLTLLEHLRAALPFRRVVCQQ